MTRAPRTAAAPRPPLFHAALVALLLATLPQAARSRQDDSNAPATAERAEERRPAPAEPVREVDAPAARQPQRDGHAAAAGTTVPPVRPTVDVAGKGVIELASPAAPRGRWKGFPISLSLRDAPLPEVLRSFARLAGFNLVLDPRVQGQVTVELRDVPWDQALHVILKTHGMGAEVDGRVWLVEPR